MAIRKIFVLALTVPLCALAVTCGGGEMPEAQAPDTETAATPEAPETAAPEAPEAPEAPAAPETPEAPEAPSDAPAE